MRTVGPKREREFAWYLEQESQFLFDTTWPLVLIQVYSEVIVPTEHFPTFPFKLA